VKSNRNPSKSSGFRDTAKRSMTLEFVKAILKEGKDKIINWVIYKFATA
jgi:hypothetical protein